jgi:hypothetical protein
MSRSRTFCFKIEDGDHEYWNNITNFQETHNCEYITASKTNNENNTFLINGFVRFYSAKTLNAINKFFMKPAKVEIETNKDNYYKDLFSKSSEWFEKGSPAKNNKNTNKKPSKIKIKLAEKDKLIIELFAEKDKITNQLAEQQNNMNIQIQELLKHKDNETEQLKQITELCMTIAKNNPSVTTNSNTNTNTNTNSNNKIKNNFNINIFLNEHCNKAVNLIDFVKGIQIELQDLLLYNKLGHAGAVSKIIDNAYKKLDLTMRPIHCTDLKRETLYVRNMNEWLNDESKEISGKAMEIVSNTSITQMNQWKDANPDYESKQDKKTEYYRLMRNVIGSTSDAEENAEKKKFIRNVSQNTMLDKDTALNVMNA